MNSIAQIVIRLTFCSFYISTEVGEGSVRAVFLTSMEWNAGTPGERWFLGPLYFE